jgi:hypothetical protein
MQDEHREAVVELRALQRSATLVWDLVLKGSNEASSLAAPLSSTTDLINFCVGAVAANRVHWEARLALTATLSHFPELGPPHEMGMVSVFVDIVIDDPTSLDSQLCDTFSDAIYRKGAPRWPFIFGVELKP